MPDLGNIKENSEHGPHNSFSGRKYEFLGTSEELNEPKRTSPSTASGNYDNGIRNEGSNSKQVEPKFQETSGLGKLLGCQLHGWSNIHNRHRIVIAALNLIVIVFLFGFITASTMLQTSPVCPSRPSCPEDWIMWKGNCYYISVTEGTWNSSQNSCTLHGGSLFVPGPEEEMVFIRRIVDHTEYWIGLWREKEGEPWKRPNGSVFNNSIEIRADGPCAYLDKKSSSRSTWCDTDRNWICTKSLPSV